MPNDFEARVALLASDRESGASEILDEAMALLRDAIAAGVPLLPVAKGICRAQPSMASMWNVAVAVLASDRPLERLDLFAQRVARAPEALVRVASDYFLVDASGPLRLVSISFSRTVLTIIERIAESRPLRVSCSESRPALEGRRFAARLTAAGIPVTFFADAAIGQALGAADAVLVGADAVAPEWFLNKVGTRMLAAAAQQQGVPVHVIATRDKFVSHAVGARLAMREGAAAEVWETPPAGVTVRNPYFESIPLELVATLITEMGVLGPSLAAEVCEAISREQPPDLIDKI
jgi:translation initiation factor 2B subunit (eIF-2B alpha/beta/delta family)